jgi:TolA protein
MKPGEQQHEPQPSSGMGRMVVVSAVLHVVVIVFILVAMNRKDSESSPRLMSHTVELVGPELLGPAGGGGSSVESGPAVRPPAEQKSLPPKLERKEPPPVKRPMEPTQEKPEKVQAKEPPSLKPLQARKEGEPPKPKEQPPSKAKETPKVVAAKPSLSEPPAEKPKPVEPAKPKEAVKLPEKMKKTELKPTKKTEDTPEPEKVVKKIEKNPVEKEQPRTKNPPVEKSPSEKKPKETTQKSATPSATSAKEQKAEEREEREAREREQQILAAVEKIRADEEATRREKEITAALERVQKGVTEKADRKENEGATSRETPGPSLQERQGNIERESGGGGGGHGMEFIAYTQRLKQRVKEAWILAERKPGLRAVVRFGVEPNGEVMEVELADSSGDRSFDQSALRAVRKASPFPSPPEAYREEFATQKVEITFSGEERIR